MLDFISALARDNPPANLSYPMMEKATLPLVYASLKCFTELLGYYFQLTSSLFASVSVYG